MSSLPDMDSASLTSWERIARQQWVKASTPLMVNDSERTLFVKRGGGKSRGGDWTGSSGGTRRSAYFVDSDTSGTSTTSDTPRRVLIAKNDALNASAAALRMGGRRILDGIRQSPGKLVYSNQQQPQKQEEQGHHNGADEALKRASSFSPSSDIKQDKQAPVFYGTVRFPASRVALWNRRATGSPMVLTPEGAAPMLVFRRNVVDAIASALCSNRETPMKDEPLLQWRGILGAAADILQGQAASDPRVRYATSSVALEILGTGNEPTPVSRVAATPRHARERVHGLKQGRGVPLSGALSMITEGDGGNRGSGGHSVSHPSEEYYRALLDDCASAIKSAKSADPAIFNPLRLHCLLKRRGSGSSNWGSDGSPPLPRAVQSRPHDQAGRATLSLRGEMIVPSVGVRLTPIPPLALLHTALYQSLLTRGAEDKPQSGLLTLNEGRRAVLLSDADPLSLRTPVVGVWVSGKSSDLNTAEGSLSSPRSHAYTFSACLRFLLSIIGGSGKRNKEAASVDAFLVLQLQGGVNGGPPMFYEACAIHNSGKSSTAVNANGETGLDLSSCGFEQLDFSADVDVNVDVEQEGPGRRVAGVNGKPRGGEKGRGNGAVVIGRLRRVSNPLFAEPFRNAIGNSQGRQRATPLSLHQGQHLGSVSGPAKPPPSPQPQPSRLTTPARGQNSRWHVRHHATISENGAENADPINLVQRPQTLSATPSYKADVPCSIDSTPSPSQRREKLQPSGPDDATVNSNESHLAASESGSLQPNRVRDGATTPSSSIKNDPADSKLESEGPNEVVQSISLLTPTPSLASAVGNDEEVANASEKGLRGDSPPPITASASALKQQPVATADGQEVSTVLHNARVMSPSKIRAQGNIMASMRDAKVTKESRSLVEASLSPPPPPPSTASASSGHLLGFDLDKLDPAAREFFLAQQRQLSALEEQLRLLQAAVHDRRVHGEYPPVLQPVQYQQGLQHMRLPVDHSLFSVSPNGPILVVRAATELASMQWGGEGTVNRSRVERDSVEATETSKTDAGATLVEASTNTSLVWPSPPPREGRDDYSTCKAASVKAKAADVATPSTIALTESDSEGTGDSTPFGRHARGKHDRASACFPVAVCAAETPCTPDAMDALPDVRMTRRGDAVDTASQRSDRSDEEEYVSSGSESEDGVLEAPSLGVQVPGQDFVDAMPPNARDERSQREARRVAIVAEGPASGKKISRRHEGRDNVDRRGDRGKRGEYLATGTLGFDMRCNGDGKSSMDRVGKHDLRQRQRRNGLDADQYQMETPPVPGLRKGASVGLMPIAELVVIPRIQCGQLSDDDMVSDLDEGETIVRIESKYLKGRGVRRMSR